MIPIATVEDFTNGEESNFALGFNLRGSAALLCDKHAYGSQVCGKPLDFQKKHS